MKKKGLCLLLCILSAFTLMGCGEQLHEMTEEEEAIVVDYAAYILSKYCISAKDGMQLVYMEKEDYAVLEEDEEIETEETETEEIAETETNQSELPQEGNESGDTEETEVTTGQISLAESIGYSQLDVSYVGVSVADSYMEGKHFSLTPASGKQYAVMSFTITNPTKEAIEMDVMKDMPSFKASIDGGEYLAAEETFLLYYLSTYQGTIEAEKSVDVCLLFQIPKSEEGSISDVKLIVEQPDGDKIVQL